MATGIQTGIRTGSSPMLPTGKPAGGGGGLQKYLGVWTNLSTKMKVLVVAVILTVALGGGTFFMVSAANKPVPLYATALSPSDITEISRKLTENNINFSLDGSKIMVHPSSRSKTVGLLLSYGLPHRALTSSIADGGAMSPKTEGEKKKQATEELQFQLIDQLRQFDIIADAYVNIVIPDDDGAIMGNAPDSKAAVYLRLKPGAKPNRTQVEAIVNLVSYSVQGLNSKNITVTDTTGNVYFKDDKIAAMPDGKGGGSSDNQGPEDEHFAIMKTYVGWYQQQIEAALNKIVGKDRYTVNVSADIDWGQTKIVSTRVGDPGGTNREVEVEKNENENYTNKNGDGKAGGKPSAFDPGAKQGNTDYGKNKHEYKYKVGQTEKTIMIPPGAIKKLSAAVAVDGKHDPSELASYRAVVKGALGSDESRGDTVEVVATNFRRDVIGADQMPPDFENGMPTVRNPHPFNSPYYMLAMLVPSVMLLMILAIFLLRQRQAQTDKTGLILATGPGATTSDISDLLSDKIGRSTVTNNTQTTRANNTEQLEKLAKEKPTKVAELLKSTWISDKER